MIAAGVCKTFFVRLNSATPKLCQHAILSNFDENAEKAKCSMEPLRVGRQAPKAGSFPQVVS
jgi:hypothetical protein